MIAGLAGSTTVVADQDSPIFPGQMFAVDRPFWLTSSDFNGDGILDVASPTEVLLGLGNGSFDGAQPIGLDGIGTSVVSGDFNGDGNQDELPIRFHHCILSIALVQKKILPFYGRI